MSDGIARDEFGMFPQGGDQHLPAAARGPAQKPRVIWRWVMTRNCWRWISEDGRSAGISAGIPDAETENAMFLTVSRNFREVN